VVIDNKCLKAVMPYLDVIVVGSVAANLSDAFHIFGGNCGGRRRLLRLTDPRT